MFIITSKIKDYQSESEKNITERTIILKKEE